MSEEGYPKYFSGKTFLILFNLSRNILSFSFNELSFLKKILRLKLLKLIEPGEWRRVITNLSLRLNALEKYLIVKNYIF